jgi:hypothetical protein
MMAAPFVKSDIQSPTITRRVDTLADLQATVGGGAIQAVYMEGRTTAGDGGQGAFRWDSSDNSANVTADTQSGIYVAPDSDPTGASGCWVRVHDETINVLWFGADSTGAADIGFIVGSVLNDLFPDTFVHLVFTKGQYLWNTPQYVTRGDFVIECDGGEIINTNSITALQVYPSSLEGLRDGTARPAGFESGIDGDSRALMYEETDRLSNIELRNVEYAYTGGVISSGGRFALFQSVDNVDIIGGDYYGYSAPLEFFYCRNINYRYAQVSSEIFVAFFFKSKSIKVHGNTFSGGTYGTEFKGSYPQPGKTIYQGFDAGYQYDSDIKIYGNTYTDQSVTSIQGGYFDNSGDDISSGDPVGVTKRDWYGEVWNLKAWGNSFSNAAGSLNASDNLAFRPNVNSRYQKFFKNTLYGMAVHAVGSQYIDILDNDFIKPVKSGASILILGGSTTGGEGANSYKIKVAGNKFVAPTRSSVELSGVTDSLVENNEFVGGTSFIEIHASASTMQGGLTKVRRCIVRDNTITRDSVTDFVQGIRLEEDKSEYCPVYDNVGIGGFYTGNKANHNNDFGNDIRKKALISVSTATSEVAGTNAAWNNVGDLDATTPVPGYSTEMGVQGSVSSHWRDPMRLGTYFQWVDSTGNVRMKSSKPASDTDGTIIGP